MIGVMKKKQKIKNSFSDTVFNIVVNTLMLFALFIVLYPLYFIAISSVSDPVAVTLGETLLLPKGISFDCYTAIFKDSRILSGYSNTILYTVCGTVIGVMATILAGYSLSRNDLVGRNAIMKIFVFTMYFSGGLIPTYMIVKNIGLTNTPFVMMILGSVSVFNIIITRTFFQSTVPKELLEAAFIDGCGNGIFFFKIALPLSKSIVAVISLYYAVGHWNAFFNALIYLNEQKLYPLQLILREILFQNQTAQMDNADPDAIAQLMKVAATIKYGVIIVSSLPVLVLYPFLQKYFVKGVMIGSIKG